MSGISALYFCCQCKKVADKLGDLLFIEETSSRGFCSEPCIEEFYAPLIEQYTNVEKQLRLEHKCLDENYHQFLNDSTNIELTVSRPDYIYRYENKLGDEVYSFVKKLTDPHQQSFFVAILCMIFNSRPSFIFLASASQNEEFIKKFQTGEAIEDPSSFLSSGDEEKDVSGTPDPSYIEQKKSALLAELLSSRKEADVDYEQFHLYEEFFEETMESPDEIYVSDYDGDQLFSYIKAHDRDGVSFYYIILCVRLPESQELMIPILAFPTLDPTLCEHYREGERVSGNLIN